MKTNAEARVKPHYTLEELLAQCDPTAPADEDLSWIELRPVGREF
jgi:antitoxin ChpS